MDRTEAERLARELMHKWKCEGWTFKWSNGKRQVGAAAIVKERSTGKILRRELRLSRYLVDLNDLPEVKDTILHEIAHIKAGLKNGHNDVWKRWCIKVGAKPDRCYDDGQVNVVPPKYLVVCKTCKRVLAKRMRRSRSMKRAFCSHCGPGTQGKLEYRLNSK